MRGGVFVKFTLCELKPHILTLCKHTPLLHTIRISKAGTTGTNQQHNRVSPLIYLIKQGNDYVIKCHCRTMKNTLKTNKKRKHWTFLPITVFVGHKFTHPPQKVTFIQPSLACILFFPCTAFFANKVKKTHQSFTIEHTRSCYCYRVPLVFPHSCDTRKHWTFISSLSLLDTNSPTHPKKSLSYNLPWHAYFFFHAQLSLQTKVKKKTTVIHNRAHEKLLLL